jgi:2-C-methyl-D-erythritol 2,4-cyclodiphosphate synthase
MMPETRVGLGYDVHRKVAGRPLVLGGVEIPSEFGLEGHSDADVLIHAIADALLGAIGERDIGHHFPNTDPTLAGMSSLRILEKIRELLAAGAWQIVNIDATLVAESPKIGPHLDAMKTALGRALGLAPDRIGIKATTNEGLGFIGRDEGMAALATASVTRLSHTRVAQIA